MAGAAAMTSGAMETRVRQIMAVVFGRRLDGAPADAEGLWDSLEGINLLFALQEAPVRAAGGFLGRFVRPG